MVDEQAPPGPEGRRRRRRRRDETGLQRAERIADAYGLVLLLILATFIVFMTLPPEGAGGRVAAVLAATLTGIVALTSSDVRPERVRLATVIGVIAVVLAVIAEAAHVPKVLGFAFVIDTVLLAVAAATILRRVIDAAVVENRTILGAICVFTLLGLLFAFLYIAFGRWFGDFFGSTDPHPRAADYLFFSYVTLTTTGYGNLVPAGTLGQSFAVLEMLVGQFFLVTLVAGLVSLWRPLRRRQTVEDAEGTGAAAGDVQPAGGP